MKDNNIFINCGDNVPVNLNWVIKFFKCINDEKPSIMFITADHNNDPVWSFNSEQERNLIYDGIEFKYSYDIASIYEKKEYGED